MFFSYTFAIKRYGDEILQNEKLGDQNRQIEKIEGLKVQLNLFLHHHLI